MCVCILHLFQIISVIVWRRKFLVPSSENYVLLPVNTSSHIQGRILGAAGASQGRHPDPGLDPDLRVVPGPGEVQQVTLL